MSSVAVPRPPAPKRALPLIVIGAVLAGVIAGQLVMAGRGKVVWALPLVLLPVFLWRKPRYAPVVLLVGALAIEQFGYTVGPRAGAATAKLPLFHGIGSFHISPADLLLLLVAGIYVAKRGTGAVRDLPRTPLAKCIYALFGVVLVAIFIGKTNGGQLRYALTETRPYAYLLLTFVLSYVLITTRKAMRAVLWAVVITVGLKAFQGLLIFLAVRHYSVRPDAVLAHEEAVFFSLFLLLTLALWLFEVPGRLRTVATWLVPLVIAADLANTRRAAWLVLGVGVIAMLAVGYSAIPHRRRFIWRLGIGLGVFLTLYLPVYWNKSGGLAQPARAIHSSISPSVRDASSDLYRVQEDANLKLNIRQGGPTGKGFGVPIDYALPIQDISDIDPFIKYVPHNGVLYVLMRMGPLGGMVFWSMLGIGIVGACRLARQLDREVAVIGALTASMLVAYAFEGATDQGFFFYRIAFVVGTLLGLTEAARRLATAPAQAPSVAIPQPAVVRRAPAPRAVAAAAAVTKAVLPPGLQRQVDDSRRAQLAAALALPIAIGFLLWLLLAGGHSPSPPPAPSKSQKTSAPAAPSVPGRSGGVETKTRR